MFTFHKPKIFRSSSGCCICKAKSSSSRFTDSKRYEGAFDQCFDLQGEIRQGEICNACVLLVKRFHKLPRGSQKNWAHVVDARSGPGIKSLAARNRSSRERAEADTPEKVLKRKHVWKRKKASRKPLKSTIRRRRPSAIAGMAEEEPLLLLDKAYWKKETICCGVIYRGLGGETAVDARSYRPCCSHKANKTNSTTTTTEEAMESDVLEMLEKKAANAAAAEKLASDAAAGASSAPGTSGSVRTGAATTTTTTSSSSSSSSTTTAGASDVDEGFFDRPVASPLSASGGSSGGSRTPAPSEAEAEARAEAGEEDVEDEEMEEEEEDMEEEEEEVDDAEEEEDDEEEEIDDNEEPHLQAMEATT